MKRKRRKVFKLPKITRIGRVYILITLGVGFAAINTAHNLLFLCLGLLLGLLLASGVMSEINLRRIRVSRSLPARISAGEPFLVDITVHNTKRFSSTFSLEVEDLVRNEPQKRRCFFLKIDQGKHRNVAYRAEISQRGIHTFEGFRIRSSYPFGLVLRTLEYPFHQQAVVFPAPVPLIDFSLELAGGSGFSPSNIVGRGDDFFELRQFAAGDDPRRIHWKSTARRGIPMVRHTEADEAETVIILLDIRAPNEDQHPGIERAIGVAAYLAEELVRRYHPVYIFTPGNDSAEVHRSGSPDRLLHFLALAPVYLMDQALPEKPSTLRGKVIRINAEGTTVGKDFLASDPGNFHVYPESNV